MLYERYAATFETSYNNLATGDGPTMTFTTIIVVLVIGLTTLLIGLFMKKRWVTILSLIPLGLSFWNFMVLFTMGM